MTLERKMAIILKKVCPEMEQNKFMYYNTPQREKEMNDYSLTTTKILRKTSDSDSVANADQLIPRVD
tara:strand:+ start:480 stop:680 length:201 start_codon:yes stop_codon:yes gene_type:complete